MKQLAYSLCAAVLFSIALSGCPMQPSFKTQTITPIYAATNQGLYVYDGTSWTRYTNAAANSVVVSGSGSGASVFVGTDNGISYTSNLASWGTWNASDGLGNDTVNKLFLGSNLIAATAGGVSTYNSDIPANDVSSPTWTNDSSVAAATAVCKIGTYTYVTNASSLYVYNGTSLRGSFSASAIVSGSSSVRALVGDASLNVVVGTNNGCSSYDGGTSFTPILSGIAVNDLFIDANSYLYAATASGLFKIGSSAQLFASGSFTCVYVDGAGTIYAGTSSGLKIYSSSGSLLSTQLPGVAINQVLTTAPLYSF